MFQSILNEVNKKQDVLTDRAVKAKETYDQLKTQYKFGCYPIQDNQNQIAPDEDMGELKRQIRSIKQLIIETHLQEISELLTNPAHVLGIQFWSGFVKGIGFAVGFISIFLVSIYVILSAGYTASLASWIKVLL